MSIKEWGIRKLLSYLRSTRKELPSRQSSRNWEQEECTMGIKQRRKTKNRTK